MSSYPTQRTVATKLSTTETWSAWSPNGDGPSYPVKYVAAEWPPQSGLFKVYRVDSATRTVCQGLTEQEAIAFVEAK